MASIRTLATVHLAIRGPTVSSASTNVTQTHALTVPHVRTVSVRTFATVPMVLRAHAAKASLTGVPWVVYRIRQPNYYPGSLDKVPASMEPLASRSTRRTNALAHPVGQASSATSRWSRARTLLFVKDLPYPNSVDMVENAKTLAIATDASAPKAIRGAIVSMRSTNVTLRRAKTELHARI